MGALNEIALGARRGIARRNELEDQQLQIEKAAEQEALRQIFEERQADTEYARRLTELDISNEMTRKNKLIEAGTGMLENLVPEQQGILTAELGDQPEEYTPGRIGTTMGNLRTSGKVKDWMTIKESDALNKANNAVKLLAQKQYDQILSEATDKGVPLSTVNQRITTLNAQLPEGSTPFNTITETEMNELSLKKTALMKAQTTKQLADSAVSEARARLLRAQTATEQEKPALIKATIKNMADRLKLGYDALANSKAIAGMNITSREGIAAANIASREGIAADRLQFMYDNGTRLAQQFAETAGLKRQQTKLWAQQIMSDPDYATDEDLRAVAKGLIDEMSKSLSSTVRTGPNIPKAQSSGLSKNEVAALKNAAGRFSGAGEFANAAYKQKPSVPKSVYVSIYNEAKGIR